MKHAYFSPSGAQYWMLCPAWAHANHNLPNTTNAASEWGTYVHEHAERAVLDPGLLDLLEDDARVLCEEYVAYIDSIVKDIDLGSTHQVLKVEEKVSLRPLGMDIWGTADCLIIDKARAILHVIDLKTGKWPVDVGEQLIIYALGALESLPTHLPVSTVKMHIVQPSLGRTQVEVMSVANLYAWAEDVLRPAYDQARMYPRLEKPGEKQCRFCKAAATCASRQRMITDAAVGDFSPTTPEAELEAAYAKVPDIRRWCDAVEAEVLRRLEAGEPVRGYELGTTKTHRKWVSEAEVLKRLDRAGYEASEFVKGALESVATIEKVLGRDECRDLLGDMIVRPEGRPKIQKAVDSTSNSAEDDFS